MRDAAEGLPETDRTVATVITSGVYVRGGGWDAVERAGGGPARHLVRGRAGECR
ncbi:hypothetical protein GCM10027073_34580 [Streptomyces chlorus]